MPDLSSPGTESDFYFVQADDPETAVLRIIELVKTRIPKRFGLDPIRDIQVLCPMNRGGVGARSLNIELQAALNPAGERKVERFGWTFAPGDKAIHKSQGSEYPAVVIPVMTQHYTMLQFSGRRRWSKLAEWLRLGQPASRQIGMVG
jgi:ATP-dependent exoDNAse (exonuclease V) alpha subunit